MKNICIVGSGSFGCALAYVLSKNNDVKMWSYTKEERDSINNNHSCLLMPSIILKDNIKCYQDYELALNDSEIIALVSPSKSIRKICQSIKKYYKKQDVIIASKGIENDIVFSNIVQEELGVLPSVISGPSFAYELANEKKVYVDFAGNINLIKDLETDNFKLMYQDDLIGVQIGGALKNIIALIVGMGEGLGYKDSIISYLVVKGLDEIKKIGVALGAKEKTFYGLSGLGDILTSSFGTSSRNKKAGMLLSKGYKVDDVIQQIGSLAEGFESLNNAHYIIKKYKLNCPLIVKLYKIVYEGENVKEILV